ncbi:HAD family hydrolase [Deltaproteobacteria bacterium OttesenSCG-928-M10]|nr:HAD family hydrolase [Deltaproteobacteria bacterium OttesenSCG-928-M10]
MFKAAIFDLDGTLLFTLEDLADSLNYVLAEEGLPVHGNDKYRLMVGNGLEMLVVRALPAGMRIPAHVRPILRKFVERYRTNQCRKTRPYPGIEDMLAALRERGFKLAVLSNKAHLNTLEVVTNYFPGVFDRVLGMRPDVPPKPDPAGALEIALDLSLDPADFIFIGDSDVDMETARKAGMFAMGAAWGYRSAGELRRAGAETILESPLDLLRHLDDR